jgi:hypothetical protein
MPLYRVMLANSISEAGTANSGCVRLKDARHSERLQPRLRTIPHGR